MEATEAKRKLCELRSSHPTALHYGAMSDDIWVVTRGDGTQRIEVLYECYDKIEWLDFDELK